MNREEFLDQSNRDLFEVYRIQRRRILEDAGIEENLLAGSYAYRQLLELVQNAADAILEATEEGLAEAGAGRIEVLQHGHRLYVANTGAPLNEAGLEALLGSHSSPKRGNQIGRFGLGFKSLLRLGGCVDIFGKAHGDFRFDPERCREEILREFGGENAAGLRMAWPLSAGERAEDEVLARFDWAETVVRAEIVAEGLLEHVSQEIEEFPAEFLLFFPAEAQLVLEGGTGKPREVSVEASNGLTRLVDSGEESQWRVVHREVAISDPRAKKDATHIHARDSMPVAWAVPLDGAKEAAGRFWAFFPTRTPTYLPGILNAPWKLNDDRTHVIGGEWNSALMAAAAQMIAECLPEFATPEDPGRPLDLFPRQMERKDEEAAPLIDSVWGELEAVEVVADATGCLRRALELCRPPRDNAELAGSWQALAGEEERVRLVHSSCLEGQRGSRLNAFADRLDEEDSENPESPGLQTMDVGSWFGAVASSNVERAIEVLELAEAFSEDCNRQEWRQALSEAAIVPSEAGSLVLAHEAIFAPAGVSVPGRETVAPALAAVPEARRILEEVLGIGEVDDEFWRSYLSAALPSTEGWRNPSEEAWRGFWQLLRKAPFGVRSRFLEQNGARVRVRRRDGRWALPADVLLPGSLVSANDESANSKVLLDEREHGPDREWLAVLEIREQPEGTSKWGWNSYGDNGELWGWLEACRRTYKEQFSNPASWNYLVAHSFTMPNGCGLLARLTGPAKSKLTLIFMGLLEQEELTSPVRFGHATVASYPELKVPHPFSSWLLTHGALDVAGSPVPLGVLVAKRDLGLLGGTEELEGLRPMLETLGDREAEVEVSEGAVLAFWDALFGSLVTRAAPAELAPPELWSSAAEDGVAPDRLQFGACEAELGEIFVTTSADLAREARAKGRPALALEQEVLQLWLELGARDLSSLVEPSWSETAGPAELLVSVVPDLKPVLRAQGVEGPFCQPVSGLRLSIEGAHSDVPCLLWDGTILLDQERFGELSRSERMERLVSELEGASWLSCPGAKALSFLGDAKVEERRAEVAQGGDLAERLRRAVGGRRGPLLEVLGDLQDLEELGSCTALQLAELVLAHLGPASLSNLKESLEGEGLNPPGKWGTARARSFVASLGFPAEFASASRPKRRAEEEIPGPIKLPELHDFQQEVLDGLTELLRGDLPRPRAVVSLPTGSGKTRVTVEAAVRLVLAPEEGRRVVVWVAQTDELCEQAVEAFRQVWMNLGAEKVALRMVRLWGGNPNPQVSDDDRPVAVVASIQTLNNRLRAEELAWLREPGLVVVDECHHAITPSYSNLLRWLDAAGPEKEAVEKREPPFLGLSATPFRADDDESARLAKRFGSRWFPVNQDRLHADLRAQRVLAEVEYQPLESGTALTQEELRRLELLPEPWDGIQFENLLEEINQRLAGDEKRNQRLLEFVEASDRRSILLFANSVRHAEELSLRLNRLGVSAHAVSGETSPVARRYFLRRFQEGEARVLCNHTVLATGFDAPKTDMVVIARQVFSPVRYMQMVGRGLRGEKNGGTVSCRVVTVMDNLGRFRDRHPYHYCREYFVGVHAAKVE